MVTRLFFLYFEYENDDGKEYGKPMHSTQITPDSIILLVGHPRVGDKNKEDDIHKNEHNDQSENLE